jgi:hypothetical protein
MSWLSILSSENLHWDAIQKIFHAPMSVFDTTVSALTIFSTSYELSVFVVIPALGSHVVCARQGHRCSRYVDVLLAKLNHHRG